MHSARFEWQAFGFAVTLRVGNVCCDPNSPTQLQLTLRCPSVGGVRPSGDCFDRDAQNPDAKVGASLVVVKLGGLRTYGKEFRESTKSKLNPGLSRQVIPSRQRQAPGGFSIIGSQKPISRYVSRLRIKKSPWVNCSTRCNPS
jgi:hypothetical protein